MNLQCCYSEQKMKVNEVKPECRCRQIRKQTRQTGKQTERKQTERKQTERKQTDKNKNKDKDEWHQ